MMTEREAEAFAAKLTRIWMPDGSFGEGASWELQDGRFRFVARMTDEVKMWFGESELCEGEGYHLERTQNGRVVDLWYCSQHQGRIERATVDGDDGQEEFSKLRETYHQFMRSHCWLSGCPIDCTDEERERWTQWFQDREAEGAGTPTNSVEWEVQRVATALGVEAVTVSRNVMSVHYEGLVDGVRVTWELGDPNAKVKNVYAGTRSYCGVFLEHGRWQWEEGREGHEQIAKGLYRLGIDDEDVLAQLNTPLTAHEKLELRHAMPREFWPQKWVGETTP